jgi:hypothetical protein
VTDRGRTFVKFMTMRDFGTEFEPGDRVRVFNMPGQTPRENMFHDATGPYEVIRCEPLSGDEGGLVHVELRSIGYR